MSAIFHDKKLTKRTSTYTYNMWDGIKPDDGSICESYELFKHPKKQKIRRINLLKRSALSSKTIPTMYACIGICLNIVAICFNIFGFGLLFFALFFLSSLLFLCFLFVRRFDRFYFRVSFFCDFALHNRINACIVTNTTTTTTS